MRNNTSLRNKSTKSILMIISENKEGSMSLRIETILCRAGRMDNYSYLLTDEETGTSAIIDPSEATPIIKRCDELGCKPSYILNTHHHYDHTDANIEIKKYYQAKVVGSEYDAKRIPGLDESVKDGATWFLGKSKAEIIRVDGHTIGHILWYFPEDKALFTGDTLFNLCIGGLFEGTSNDMFASLNKIKNLPDDTLFYPGHEYTIHGIPFALHYMPNNPELQNYIQHTQQKLNRGLPVGPISLGIEKQCNPYLKAQNLKEFESLLGQ